MISEGNKNEMNCVRESVEPSQSNMLVRNIKMFKEVENAGCEISYRCNNCRNCKACKEHSQADMMSVRWFPEEDLLSLDINELNFAKKCRKKPSQQQNIIPANITRRHCVSSV